MKIKVLFLFIGIILALIFTEMSLYVLGKVYKHSKSSAIALEDSFSIPYDRNNSYEVYSDRGDDHSIITIGDSYTNAGNVTSNFSYPFQLKKLIRQNRKKATIINMGLCEDSTLNTYKRLKSYFNKRGDKFPKVTKVLVLVGAADYFEPFRYNFRKDYPEVSTIDMHSHRPWYYNFRTYKLMRYFSLYFKLASYNVSEVSEGDLKKLNGQLDALLSSFANKDEFDTHKKLMKDLVPTFEMYCKEQDIDIESAPYLLQSLAVYITAISNQNLRYDDSTALILKIIETVPQVVWSYEFDELHYRLIQSFTLQSKVSPTEYLSTLQHIVSKHPQLQANKNFTTLVHFMGNYETQFGKIEKLRRSTWDNLIKLSKDNRFELVVLNYPTNYKEVNRVLNEISISNSLRQVELNSFFAEKRSAAERRQYFVDDDHLTPRGYQEMAERIFNEVF